MSTNTGQAVGKHTWAIKTEAVKYCSEVQKHASECETLILTEFQLLKVEGKAAIERQTKQNLRKITLGTRNAAEWSTPCSHPGIEPGS